AVAVVPVEGGAHLGPVEPLVPLAGVALLGPLAHAGDVGDGGVDLLGGGGDVPADLDPLGHAVQSTTPAVSGSATTGSGIARDFEGRTRSALEFLRENALPVT